MNKQIYLINGLESESYESFTARMMGLAESIVDRAEVLKLTLTKAAPPLVSIIPFKKKKVAAFSVYSEREVLLQELAQSPGFAGAYAAEEAIPRAYKRDWADKTFTPGICLFTLFKQKQDISYEAFIHFWHNVHTPLSLKILPLWNYNRNVVKQKRTEDSIHWDGIVEEQFKTQSDLLNPFKFFGNPLVMFYRMWQVYIDTKSFLDYDSIEPYFAHEIYIKS